MWKQFYQPTTLVQALDLLRQQSSQARLVAGGTDVLVELQRGVKPTETLIDLSALHELKVIRHEDGIIKLGALTTHNDVVASADCVRYALPLAQACWEVGAPQIRNRATVVGNLVTASPANDTITALMALNAEVVIVNADGERVVNLEQFYPGFRRTVLQADEMIREIRIPALKPHQRGIFLKLGLRRAQAISVIDLAMVLTINENVFSGDTVEDARIALGCLAPTVVRAPTAEAYLRDKFLYPDVCAEAGRLATQDVKPIDDVRGSAEYRLLTLESLIAHGLERIGASRQWEGWPLEPVLLSTDKETRRQGDKENAELPATRHSPLATRIELKVNGVPHTLTQSHTKSLLDALREEVGLTGTKEGCGEGECGACTVWLNGQAVMSCLVPAAQAHGSEVVTIEGLADEQQLHPLQQAFIDNASVQCGYCIPGMIMAGAKLLDETAKPTMEQIQTALSGNICRCTGYRKILDAVIAASGTDKVRG
ncbi:MAG: FAD binding domain-containing protein [Caldilineaceae bacterium]